MLRTLLYLAVCFSHCGVCWFLDPTPLCLFASPLRILFLTHMCAHGQGNDALHVARAFCMHECQAVLRDLDAADGYVEFKCVAAKVGDTECFVAVSGPSAGNCYSAAPDDESGQRQYLGRLDLESNLIDSSLPEAFGPGPDDVACPQDTAVLMEVIKVDGQRYLQQLGQGLVFSYQPPHDYVGLRFKNGSIHYGRLPPGPTDYPPQIPRHMRPGRPAFVIGALNGSVEAAREYNRKLHEGAWKDLHEYGIFKLRLGGENFGYPWYMRPSNAVDAEEESADNAVRGGGRGESIDGSSGMKRDPRSGQLVDLAAGAESRDLMKRRRRRKELKKNEVEKDSDEDLVEQLVDGLWEMTETQRLYPDTFRAVGDDVIKIPKDIHPLWAKGACRCPHCEDMRSGTSSIICHCKHCYLQGYWKKKDLASLEALL